MRVDVCTGAVRGQGKPVAVVPDEVLKLKRDGLSWRQLADRLDCSVFDRPPAVRGGAVVRRGDRIELVRCTDPHTSLKPSDRGTVFLVDEPRHRSLHVG